MRIAVGLSTALATSLTVISLAGPAASVTATAQTFTYTGLEQTYTVPAGTTAVTITAVGAPGETSSEGGTGGQGASVTATVPAAPGDTLYVEVGGSGAQGGFNGGGAANDWGPPDGFGGGGYPGDGGGASDVRTVSTSSVPNSSLTAANDSRLVVAGGGGGGSFGWLGMGSGSSAGDGAVTGAGAGGAGADSWTSGVGGNGGFGGTTGGSGGEGSAQAPYAGAPGSRGVGGSAAVNSSAYGGAGGGGFYGGGGGGDGGSSGGGGGAGSSYSVVGQANTSMTTDATGTATVVITPVIPEGTTTFSSTGVEQQYTVPAGTTAVTIVAVGARGGAGPSNYGTGQTDVPAGSGARVSATVPLPSGTETLYVEVGGAPAAGPGHTGGFNGGGSSQWAGSGGGASDVRTTSIATIPNSALTSSNDSRLLVAGGGGGGGFAQQSCSLYLNKGGDAGTAVSGAGAGGNGGTGTPCGFGTSAGGNGGLGGTAGGVAGTGTYNGNNGARGLGASIPPGYSYGGGGGGGYFGGGSGGQSAYIGGGGGAGSSFWASGASNTSMSTDTSGTPSVTIVPITGTDTQPPTVTGVTSSTTNGTYKAGDLISIQVGFAEPVTVTGTPQLTLETGTVDRVVNYSSGSGTTTLTFPYTVQSGDSAADLDYVGAGSLALNGGTIKDAAGNNATLTLPSPGAAGSLGANKAIVIDTEAPVVTVDPVTSPTGDTTPAFSGTAGTLTSDGSTLTVKVWQGSDTSGTLLHTYGDVAVGSSGTWSMTIPETDALPAGTYTVRASQSDAAGNTGNSATVTFTVDTGAPSVSNVTSSTGNGSYNTGDEISVEVEFSEAVTVTGTPQLVLATGGAGGSAAYTSGSDTTTLTFAYTVQAADTSADLDYVDFGSLALNEGTIKDAAGNDAVLTLPEPGAAGSLGANKAIVIDTEAPVVTVDPVTSPTSDTTPTLSGTGGTMTGDDTTVTVKVWQGSDTSGTLLHTYADVAVGGIGARLFAPVIGSPWNMTVPETDALPARTYTVRASQSDAAGNTGNSATVTFTVDTGAPVVSNVTSSTGNGSYNTGDEISVQVEFSEAVTVTGTPQLALETGATNRVVPYTSGSDTSTLTFSYTVQVGDTSADLDYVYPGALTLNGGTIKDAAGNDAVLTLATPGVAGSLGANKAIVIDTTSPTVTINEAAGQADPTSSSPVNFTVVFSEAVTGFATGDVTLSGTSDTSGATAAVTGSGTTYQVAVSGMTGDGTVVASVDAGVAVDGAGNANVASTSTDNTVTYNAPDATSPTVTINEAAGQADPTSSSPVDFTVVFSEPVTGFATGDVTLSGTSDTSGATAAVTGSGTTYQVAVSGMTGDGTVVASVDAAVAVDGAGNPNVASTSTDNTVTYDTTSPTVTINEAAGQADPTSGSPVKFTVVFSETVTGFTEADVTVSGTAGATAAESVTEVSPNNGTTYEVVVSGMTGSGTVVASVDAGVAVDAADNANVASTSTDHTVTYNAPDATAPTVTIDQAPGQADPTSSSPVDFTVVFSEPVTGFVTGDVALSGTAGATTAVVSGSGTTYNVAVTGMTSSGTVIASVNAGVALDAADNANVASTSTDNTVTYNAPASDPITKIAELRADVVAFDVGKTGDRLLSPLDRASAAVVSGKTTVALRQMDSFSKTVESLRIKMTLTQEQADHLKAHAQEIVTLLQP